MTCPKSQTYEHKAGDDSSRISISSVQLCPTLCDPMDCSMTDFPVHHQLLELARTHVHPVGDAVQPSHPLSSPSPPSFSLAQLSVPPPIRRLSFLCPPACFCLLLNVSASGGRVSPGKHTSPQRNGLKSVFHVAALVSGIKLEQCPNKKASEHVFQCLPCIFLSFIPFDICAHMLLKNGSSGQLRSNSYKSDDIFSYKIIPTVLSEFGFFLKISFLS